MFINSFGGYLVSSFGYSELRALVLFMPASAVAVVCITAAGYVAPCRVKVDAPVNDTRRILGNRFPHHRILVAIAFILPSLMGNILLWKMRRDNKSGLLAGLYIVRASFSAS